MAEIEVGIKKIENGWIVEDSYYQEKIFFSEYDDAAVHAKKVFTRYRKDEVIYL